MTYLFAEGGENFSNRMPRTVSWTCFLSHLPYIIHPEQIDHIHLRNLGFLNVFLSSGDGGHSPLFHGILHWRLLQTPPILHVYIEASTRPCPAYYQLPVRKAARVHRGLRKDPLRLIHRPQLLCCNLQPVSNRCCRTSWQLSSPAALPGGHPSLRISATR